MSEKLHTKCKHKKFDRKHQNTNKLMYVKAFRVIELHTSLLSRQMC